MRSSKLHDPSSWPLWLFISLVALLAAACPSFPPKDVDDGSMGKPADDDTADDDTADDDTADDDTADNDTSDDDTGDDDDADDDSGGDTVDVQISTLGSYSPDPVSVRVGDSVRWNNNDLLRKHSATQGNTGEPDPDWDTGLIDSDGQALITFHAAGTFVYHCKQHGGENGMQVIVQP